VSIIEKLMDPRERIYIVRRPLIQCSGGHEATRGGGLKIIKKRIAIENPPKFLKLGTSAKHSFKNFSG